MTNTSGRQVILGTGPLGLAVMDALVERGYGSVVLANRSGTVGEQLPAGVSLVKGDVSKPDDVARLAQGASVVFQCAQPPYHAWPEQFPPIIAAIIEGMSRVEARLVMGDNLYMYGSTGGRPISEDLPYAATGRKGRTRAQMAQRLLDAHEAGKIQVVIGRASDFSGPRVLGSAVGDTVFGAALQGKTVNLMGNIDLPHTYTYIADFGRALVTLAEQDAALGRAWHVPSAETLSTRQFLDLVGDAVGHPLKVRTAGPLMLTLVGLFNPAVREFKEMLYEFSEPYVVDHSRFERAFGAQTTPHQEAIRETVTWYRAKTGHEVT